MTEERNGLPELPQGWAWTTIDEIGELLRGVSYKKHEASKEPREEYVPVLRANNINSGLNFDDLVYVPRQRVKDEQLLRAGDIVICMSSGSKHLVGKASQAIKDFYGGFGAFCGLVRVSEELAEKYVGFFFQSRLYRNAISRLSSGVNINNLRRDHIESMPLPLAPLPEQQRIVAKIEELFTQLDAGVAALEKAKAQLRRYRQAVLKAAVEGELTREWREAHRGELEPVSVLLERIKKERRRKKAKKKDEELPPVDMADLPKLPEGWVWTRVGEIGLVASGQTPKGINEIGEDGEIPFYKVGDMNTPGNEKFMAESRIYLTPADVKELRIRIQNKGTVIFPKRGGAIATNKKRILSQPSTYDLNIMGILPLIIPYKFFYHWLLSVDLFTLADGSNVPQINHKDIEPLPFPLPPLAEQNKIVEEVEHRLSVADEMEKAVDQSLKRAERLRQSILKRAFEGKLVPQDPSDEPASVLLEHIKAEKARREAERKGKSRSRKKKRPQQLKLL